LHGVQTHNGTERNKRVGVPQGEKKCVFSTNPLANNALERCGGGVGGGGGKQPNHGRDIPRGKDSNVGKKPQKKQKLKCADDEKRTVKIWGGGG